MKKPDNQTALEPRQKDAKIKIGEYYISYFVNGTYWIEHESGEGMQVSEKFEKMLDAWYKENF